MAVVKDIGAGAVLGDAGHVLCPVQLRRPAHADLRCRVTGTLEDLERLTHKGHRCRFIQRRRVAHQAAEREIGQTLNVQGKVERLLRRLDPGAAHPRLALHPNFQRATGLDGDLAHPLGDQSTIAGQAEFDAVPEAVEEGPQAIQLCLTEQVVRQVDVVEAGLGKDLGFTQLLHGDALGAGRDLLPANRRHFVRFDVRPIADPDAVAIVLDEPNAPLHAVQVNDQGRCFHLAHGLPQRGRPPALVQCPPNPASPGSCAPRSDPQWPVPPLELPSFFPPLVLPRVN